MNSDYLQKKYDLISHPFDPKVQKLSNLYSILLILFKFMAKKRPEFGLRLPFQNAGEKCNLMMLTLLRRPQTSYTTQSSGLNVIEVLYVLCDSCIYVR